MWGRVGGDALDLGTLALGLERATIRSAATSAWRSAAVAGVTALDMICAQRARQRARAVARADRDYSDRRGLPRPPEAMRGAARDVLRAANDMRIPEALRPYQSA